jgi:S-DNA-T family DNA segregation ATPase FtsK/SpoIIIE
VLATQRPSVDVVTGLIKANLPSRIAFAVSSQVDSRVILDSPGAERLLGRGDMLLMTSDSSKLARIQGCYVSDREIDAIVAFWRAGRQEEELREAAIDPWIGILDQLDNPQDQLIDEAIRLLEGKRQASTSLLQRGLHIGYPRAARLMEELEQLGVVGPDEGGGRNRAVLMQKSQESPAVDWARQGKGTPDRRQAS